MSLPASALEPFADADVDEEEAAGIAMDSRALADAASLLLPELAACEGELARCDLARLEAQAHVGARVPAHARLLDHARGHVQPVRRAREQLGAVHVERAQAVPRPGRQLAEF